MQIAIISFERVRIWREILCLGGMTIAALAYLLPFEESIFFATYLFQSLLFLGVWHFRDRFSNRKLIVGALVLSCVNIAGPLVLENDPYRYFAEAKLSQSHSVYRDAVSAIKPDLDVEFYSNVPYPEVKSIYPPVTHYYHSLLYHLSGEEFEPFLWGLKILNFIFLVLALYLAALSYDVTQRFRSTALMLMHPVLQIELLRNAHFDALLLLCIVIAYTAKPFLAGVFSLIGFQIKFLSIIPAIARKFYLKPSFYLGIVGGSSVFALFFLGDIQDWLHNLWFFADRWEMNSGPFRLMRNVLELFLEYSVARKLTIIPYLFFTGIALLLIHRSKDLRTYDKIFWSYFVVLWMGPIFNPWYLTWFLPFAFFGADALRKLLLFTPVGLYYGFWVYGNPNSHDYDPTWFNVEHAFIILILLSFLRARFLRNRAIFQ